MSRFEPLFMNFFSRSMPNRTNAVNKKSQQKIHIPDIQVIGLHKSLILYLPLETSKSMMKRPSD